MNLKVEDYFQNGRRSVLRLSTKGGGEHDGPCHHRLDQRLHDYIEVAGVTDDVMEKRGEFLERLSARKKGRVSG